MKKTVTSALFAGLLAAEGAHATTLTCSTVSTVNFTAPAFITVALNAGETLTISTGSPDTLQISIEQNGQGGSDDGICNPAFDGTSCDGFRFTAANTADYGVEAFSQGGEQFTMSCAAGGAAGTGAQGQGMTTATANAALAAGSASASAIGNAIGNAIGGPGGVQATQNLLRFSTRGQGDAASRPWDMWFSVEGRLFDGTVTGSGVEGTLGADVALGGAARIGAVLSYGSYDLTTGGTNITTEALSYGPYAAIDLNETWQAEAYVVFASPDYRSGATRFTASRTAYGANVTAAYSLGTVAIDSFLGVSGFSEALPAASGAARTITSVTGTVGSRATFNPDSNMRPWISLAAELTDFGDGLGIRTTSVSPRLGAGVTLDGAFGKLEMSVDGGELFQGTRDYGLGLGYSFSF